jgi:uncharacterized membrane protein
MHESNQRSLTKTISWRLCGSTATFLISYAILGNFTTSSTIAFIQLTFNTVLYWIHERLWDRVDWGRK